MSGWPRDPKQLGKEHRRYGAPAQVSGTAKYASDVQPVGWLYGMILRSSWAAARIRAIDLQPALNVPGIKAAVTANDPPFTVRYYGEELAAVAGVSKQACLDALKAIKVDADPLPFVVKEEDALRDTSPRVFENQANGGAPRETQTGDIDIAFRTADKIVQGFFQTPVQLHHCLETHGNTIQVSPEDVTCWASTQGIFSVRDGLADNLGISLDKVHVISEFMGGGFGSKFGAGVEGGLAAQLSKEAGNLPVRLMLTRFDEALAVGNRPSSFQKVRLGAKNDGTLVAYELEAFGTAGYASGSASAGGGGGAGFPAPYIYRVPSTRVRQTTVAINAGSARAMRAPGHPQASFGMESILDEMAFALGMDPVELRLKNDPSDVRRQQFQIAAERFGWSARYRALGSSDGPVKTGIGCAGATWGGGGHASEAEVRINPDGSIEVRCGTQDLGTGTKTLIAIVAAEIFGLDPSAISVKVGDTTFPPSGGSGGSTTAASVAPAVFDACQDALSNLASVSGLSDPTGTNWRTATARLHVNPIVAHGRWKEGLSSHGVGGVQMAEVEVDTETGFVRVKRVVCVQDCGLVVNRLACLSQVNGGIILGIGFALYEERILDRQTGVVLNPNFETYKLPGAADVPEIDVILQNMPERGVIGIGEPVCIPTAASIANAVSNAIGRRVTRLPITPSQIFELLGKPAVSPQARIRLRKAYGATRVS
jgi:xanthine dehydrogenase YagR molybdenum-binding subunit